MDFFTFNFDILNIIFVVHHVYHDTIVDLHNNNIIALNNVFVWVEAINEKNSNIIAAEQQLFDFDDYGCNRHNKYIRIHQVSFATSQPHVHPDNKVHGANMGPNWVLSAPGGPHVGPMNLAIRVARNTFLCPGLHMGQNP